MNPPKSKTLNQSLKSLKRKNTTPISAPLFDRLLLVYDGCRYWSEPSGRQALKWAGKKAGEFIDYAQEQRNASRDPTQYMPRPVNLYRRWKEAGAPDGNGARATKNQARLWTVRVTSPEGNEDFTVQEKDLEDRLNELREKHGESAVRVVS